MPLFRRRRTEEPPPPPMPAGPPPEDLVRLYLRGQNLEQMQRTDEARDLYERAVAGGFDSAGPYDRLIAIYLDRDAHADIARVARAALVRVKTFDTKREWYEKVATDAEEGARTRPDKRGAEF